MIDTTKYKEPIQLTNFVDIYHRSSFLEQQREELVAEVERLQKMVEAMKNCYNCKNLYRPTTLPSCNAGECCEKDEWEMQE